MSFDHSKSGMYSMCSMIVVATASVDTSSLKESKSPKTPMTHVPPSTGVSPSLFVEELSLPHPERRMAAQARFRNGEKDFMPGVLSPGATRGRAPRHRADP